MEIVIFLAVLVLGLALLLGPRVARRRRAAASPSPAANWNGAAARRTRARAARRAAAVSHAPATATFDRVDEPDEDVWDDDLDWVEAPPLHVRADPSPAQGPPPAPSGQTWGDGNGWHEPAAPPAETPRRSAVPAATLAPAPLLDGEVAARPGNGHAPDELAQAPLPRHAPDEVAPAPPLPGHAPTPPARPRLIARQAPGSTGRFSLSPAAEVAAPPAAAPLVPPAPAATNGATAAESVVPPAPASADGAPPSPPTPEHSGWAAAEDADWGLEVPPPRIARGAAAFGSADGGAPTFGTRRGGFISRHPIVLVAAYAAAGIALVVIGVSVVPWGSFSSTTSTGEESAAITPTASPAPTAAHTPAKPAVTPASTPDAAKQAAERAEARSRAAWLRERGSARRSEQRAVEQARAKARAAARRKAAQRRKRGHSAANSSQSSGHVTPPATNPTPQPAPVHHSPPPCEFCIG
jgi:hypothetical protein